MSIAAGIETVVGGHQKLGGAGFLRTPWPKPKVWAGGGFSSSFATGSWSFRSSCCLCWLSLGAGFGWHRCGVDAENGVPPYQASFGQPDRDVFGGNRDPFESYGGCSYSKEGHPARKSDGKPGVSASEGFRSDPPLRKPDREYSFKVRQIHSGVRKALTGRVRVRCAFGQFPKEA